MARRSLRSRSRWLALAFGAVLLVAAGPAPHPVVKHHSVATSTGPVTMTPEGGHLLGNPAAKLKLVEYISYTCPHCAHFNMEAETPLRQMLVGPGKGSIEVRSYIRNPIDLAAALLVDCAGPAHFIRLHDTLLSTQAQWLGKAGAVTDAQRERWGTGPISDRLRAIAADLGLYEIAAANGLDHARADRCLSDGPVAKRLSQQTEAAAGAGVEGTPGFAIDGVVPTRTYDWATLEPQLAARL